MTKHKLIFEAILLVTSMLFLLGCENEPELIEPEVTTDVKINNSLSGEPVIIDTIIHKNYQLHLASWQTRFDWENLEYLPLPPSEKNNIPMPWSNQAKTSFSIDILHDYKKQDGWVLYQATLREPHSFMLYNKYRGILRYYYYLIGGDMPHLKQYNLLNHKMVTLGSHADYSPILNFAHQNLIDIDKNSTHCTTIEQKALSDSTWYAWEYELAFDKEIYKQDHSTFNLAFAYKMLEKKTNLTINGKTLNDLNARVRLADGNYDRGESYNGPANFIIYGKKDIKEMTDLLATSDLSLLNKIYNQQSFKNILNGVISHNNSGQIQWNTNINISTWRTVVGLPGGSETFIVSGANNTEMVGRGVFYDKPLGIFYLNEKPKIKYIKQNNGSHPHQYELNISSVEYIFNPAIKEFAKIKNFNQEIVATENESLLKDFSRAELFIGKQLSSNIELFIQGVRVCFDLIPANGSKPVHIVKLFKANVISAND